MNGDLLSSLLAAGLLTVTVGTLLASPGEPPLLLTLVSATLLLVLSSSIGLSLSRSARRSLAVLVVRALLLSGHRGGHVLGAEPAEVLGSRADVRESASDLALEWRTLGTLRAAVRGLESGVSGLDAPAADASFEAARDRLAADLGEWAAVIGRVRHERQHANTAGGPSKRELRREIERSRPERLDARLGWLVARHLQGRNEVREHVHGALLVASLLAVVTAAVATFYVLPSVSQAYQAVFGVLAAALVGYYLSEGAKRLEDD